MDHRCHLFREALPRGPPPRPALPSARWTGELANVNRRPCSHDSHPQARNKRKMTICPGHTAGRPKRVSPTKTWPPKCCRGSLQPHTGNSARRNPGEGRGLGPRTRSALKAGTWRHAWLRSSRLHRTRTGISGKSQPWCPNLYFYWTSNKN